jgi:hypothetical protein
VFNSEKTSAEKLGPEEAVAAIAVVTVVADSAESPVDAETLASMLWEFEVFDEYTEDEMVEMVDRLIAIAKNEGLGPLFNVARKSLSDDLVLDAFAAGVIMVLDEEEMVIPDSKMPFLNKLHQALEIEQEEAQTIIEDVIAAFEEAEDEEYLDDEDEEVADEEDGTIANGNSKPKKL